MKDGFIDTFLGNRLFFNDPDPDYLDIRDIAIGLANQCRFIGQLQQFYSIAQHSLILCELAPEEFKLEALLHDASEAYLGDLSTPLKAELPLYQLIEIRFMTAIAEKIRFTFPLPQEIDILDKRLTLSEAILFDKNVDSWILSTTVKPIDNFTIVKYYTPTEAFHMFIDNFKILWEKKCKVSSPVTTNTMKAR